MPRSSVKKTEEKKEVKKKATAKKTTAVKKTTAKKTTATKKTAAKKSTTKKATTKKTTAKKTTATKKVTSAKKPAAKKSSTTKKTTTAKKSTTSKKKTSLVQKLKEVSSEIFDMVEYYDLPYRYDKTVVKVLAQNPNMLFVYWDISNKDIENFQKEFGSNFLQITRPVLVVHNITTGHSFEIDINDFANNWYIDVEDTKCKYVVELGRRPIQNDIKDDFVAILSSNTIEIPNDHVLFYEDNDIIQFKNVKTNTISERRVKLSNVQAIYKNFSLLEDEDKFDFENPSSQNPSSNVM